MQAASFAEQFSGFQAASSEPKVAVAPCDWIALFCHFLS
jgi:hypothetical protein